MKLEPKKEKCNTMLEAILELLQSEKQNNHYTPISMLSHIVYSIYLLLIIIFI